MTNTQKEKAENGVSMSKIEIKLQFPCVVQAQYEHLTEADINLQNHCTEHKNIE